MMGSVFRPMVPKDALEWNSLFYSQMRWNFYILFGKKKKKSADTAAVTVEAWPVSAVQTLGFPLSCFDLQKLVEVIDILWFC